MNDRVHFEIERLTLHGFSPAEQRRILTAIRAELTALGRSPQGLSGDHAAAQISGRIQAATKRTAGRP